MQRAAEPEPVFRVFWASRLPCCLTGQAVPLLHAVSSSASSDGYSLQSCPQREACRCQQTSASQD